MIYADRALYFPLWLFAEFAKDWGFIHIMSSPHYPKSNGLAESAVKNMKKIFMKATEAGEDIYMAILYYGNTPRGLRSILAYYQVEEMTSLAMKKVATQCYQNALHKILSGAAYGEQANMHRHSPFADVELSTLQGLMLALLHSLVTEDIMSCLFLADMCHQINRLHCRHVRERILEDFSFPQTDMEKAMALLIQLVSDGILKLPAHVMAIMTTLAKQYGILCVQLRTLTEVGHHNLSSRLENAVANNSPKDIFELANQGADVCGLTQTGDSFLHLAARAGRVASITALVNLNANLEAMNSDYATPLEVAVRHNRASSVKALLNFGAKYDIRLPGGDTYLHVAASGGHNEAMEALLEREKNLEKRNLLGETPLFQAIRSDNIQGTGILLKKGADYRSKLEDGDSIVHYAARSGNIKILKLLNDFKIPADMKNEEGLTPLHIACNPLVVRMLLRMGVPVNSQDNTGSTALILAAKHSKADIISVLLKIRADPNIKDHEGLSAFDYAIAEGCGESVNLFLFAGAKFNIKTALRIAAREGHTEVVKVLLAVGVEVNIDEWYVLHLAAWYGHTTTVKALLAAGAEVNAKCEDRWTALHFAAGNGQITVVMVLLDAGALVDTNGMPNTPLHMAAWNGHTAVVKVLLEAGADPAISGNDGWTPLMAASECGNLVVVQLIVDQGVNINSRDNKGCTALGYANEFRNSSVAWYLMSRGAVE